MQKIPVRQINTAPKEQGNTGRFSIRTIEQVLNGKKLVHELHRHDFFFILALHKGAGIHEIDFTPYNIHNNSIFIVRPGQVHRLELAASSTGFILEFDRSFYQPQYTDTVQRWKKASGKNYCQVEAVRFMKLHSFLVSISDELANKEDGYLEAITANLDLFFLEYVRQSQHSGTTTNHNNSYTQERFEELVHLLEANIGRLKSVAQYAGLLNLSPYQLNAITKASVGKTVSDLINEQIILEAKRYLLATPGQVKDVADHLGYEDVSYFTRFFKKHTGHSPEAFRKNFK